MVGGRGRVVGSEQAVVRGFEARKEKGEGKSIHFVLFSKFNPKEGSELNVSEFIHMNLYTSIQKPATAPSFILICT